MSDRWTGRRSVGRFVRYAAGEWPHGAGSSSAKLRELVDEVLTFKRKLIAPRRRSGGETGMGIPTWVMWVGGGPPARGPDPPGECQSTPWPGIWRSGPEDCDLVTILETATSASSSEGTLLGGLPPLIQAGGFDQENPRGSMPWAVRARTIAREARGSPSPGQESTPRKGRCFTLILPRHPLEGPPASGVPPEASLELEALTREPIRHMTFPPSPSPPAAGMARTR